MHILQIHQQETEYSINDKPITVYTTSITMHAAESGVMFTFVQTDDTEAKALRRYNMWIALAELDGGQGIELDINDLGE